MAQRHATYENSNRSHQTPCEKSFLAVYGLPIFADPRVWLLIYQSWLIYISNYLLLTTHTTTPNLIGTLKSTDSLGYKPYSVLECCKQICGGQTYARGYNDQRNIHYS